LNKPFDVIIRALTAEDAEAYRAFRLRGLREHPDAFRSDFEQERAKGLEFSRARLAENLFLGAFDPGGRLLGALGLVLDRAVKTRHVATLIAMYVVPEASRRGIGRALLDALVMRTRGIDGVEQLLLTVTDSNAPAKRLYESAGFEVFGVEPRAIKVGDRYFDKAHMILLL